jgi:hypothetical protein
MNSNFKFLNGQTDLTTILSCSICGNDITDPNGGNSCFPLRDEDDRCCDECNIRYVVPDRLRNMD